MEKLDLENQISGSILDPPKGAGSFKIPSVCMSVCMYVCMYVCNICPALTTPTILLIFGMKVGDHQSRKLTGPVFSEKFKIGVFWAFFVVPFLGCASDVTSLSKRQERMVILLMFLYSDQCGGFCVCNIMSRMSGHVYPQRLVGAGLGRVRLGPGQVGSGLARLFFF